MARGQAQARGSSASLITLSVMVQNRELVGAAIGGEAVAVTEGTINA